MLALIIGMVALTLVVVVLVLPIVLSAIYNRSKVLEIRLRHLERRVSALDAGRHEARQAAAARTPPDARPGTEGPGSEREPQEPYAEEWATESNQDAPAAGSASNSASDASPAAPTAGGWSDEDAAAAAVSDDPFRRLLAEVKRWLFGGNLLARVGVLVLFFGVAFLLKYTVARDLVPIELRLAGAALGGIGLLGLGWRLRERVRHYALVLQGGGMGIIYLTVFATVMRYELMPPGIGTIMMITLVALAGALAVLQDARSLALLGAVGGFLAPVLISSGGSHVSLFAYYLVLDLGILGIAWFRAWRELNVVGFAFTFVIGALWGYQAYRPEHFASVEPFLIAFFVLYVAVPVLFARRQPPELRGFVDGTLVFGVPLVAFVLQAALVRDFDYGLALSALAAGLFYAGLASVLWRSPLARMRMIVESFLALAVAFGTLAIPFAVDGRFTGAAWALEGAALVWVGVAQRRWMARAFGLLVQLGAGLAFIVSAATPVADVPVLNAVYMSALMLAFAGLFSGFYLHRHRERLTAVERKIEWWPTAWGVVWWFGGGVSEIHAHLPRGDELFAILVLVAVSTTAAGWLRRRLEWSHMVYPPWLLPPVMVLTAVELWLAWPNGHPFARWGLVAWAVAFAATWWLLHRFDDEWQSTVKRTGHLITLWLATFLLAWEAAWWLWRWVPDAPTWSYAAWGLVPTLVVMSLPALAQRFAWPLQVLARQYLGVGPAGLVVAVGLWCVMTSAMRGSPAPLPYVPLVNPLELVQLLALITALRWSGMMPITIPSPVRWYGLAAVAFIVINGVVARAVHFYADVPFDLERLWRAEVLQTALSITWTLAALAITVFATRLRERDLWIAGAVLIAAVVLKLFLVDLAGVATLARIVSFLVVGGLILLIGYLSPLPPRESPQET